MTTQTQQAGKRLQVQGLILMMIGLVIFVLVPVLVSMWMTGAMVGDTMADGIRERERLGTPLTIGAAFVGAATGLLGLYLWDRGRRAERVPVKVRCRSCGFLEREDAGFCSGCGNAV